MFRVFFGLVPRLHNFKKLTRMFLPRFVRLLDLMRSDGLLQQLVQAWRTFWSYFLSLPFRDIINCLTAYRDANRRDAKAGVRVQHPAY